MLLFFAAMTWALLFPLFANPGEELFDPSMQGPLSLFVRGDMYTVVWVMSWTTHALANGLGVFDANIFHPAPQALTSTEHMLGHLPIFAPVYLASHNPVLANQVNLFAGFVLSGAAMYGLLRCWGCSVVAALAGGLIFAFFPLRLQFVTHPHLVQGAYVAIALLAFDKTVQSGRVGWALVFAVSLGLQCLCSFYLAYMTLIAVVAYASCALWVGSQQSRRGFALSVVAGICGLVPFVVLALPYLAGRAAGDLPAAQEYALLRYLSVDPQRLVGVRDEGYYMGAVTAVLALFGAARSQATVPWARWGAVAVVVASLAFALGPGPAEAVLPMPYDVAGDWIPGFAAMRAPSRFVLMVMLGASALAGLGVETLVCAAGRGANGTARGVVVACVALALVAWDYRWLARGFPVSAAETAERMPAVYRALRELPPGPVLELPAGGRGMPIEQERDSLYTYRSIFHWRRLLNGRAGYEPRSYAPVMALARALPDRYALELLQRSTGLRYVIWHDSPPPTIPGLREIGRFDGATLFEVGRRLPADLRDSLLDPTSSTTIEGTALGRLRESARVARIDLSDDELRIGSGESLIFEVSLLNRGDAAWPVSTSSAGHRVSLGCLWRDGAGKVQYQQPLAGWLPYDLAPGRMVSVQVACRSAVEPGMYMLGVAAVQGGQWFAGEARRPVRVEATAQQGRAK